MFNPITRKRIVLKCDDWETKFPIEVLNMWDITDLEIIGGQFTYFPEDIGILKNLITLKIISTKISSLPCELFEIPTLKKLSIKNNLITKLPHLTQECFIEELSFGKNYLTMQACGDFFTFFKHLTLLDLGTNLLEDIPQGVAALKALKRLNLEDNKLKKAPLSLCELKELSHISLNNNPFSIDVKREIEKSFNISF